MEEKSTPLDRLIQEKEELDERITKLKVFLANYRDPDGEIDIETLAGKVGSIEAANALVDQLMLEIELSGVLNKRILLWQD